MSERSIPPFRSLSSPAAVFKQTLGRLFKNRKHADAPPEEKPGVSAASRLETLAADAIGEHAEVHSALFERAFRMVERSERLKREGTPSESAENRAGRAKEEVRDSLSNLRSSFVADVGPEGRFAFDRELERRFPVFRLSGLS